MIQHWQIGRWVRRAGLGLLPLALAMALCLPVAASVKADALLTALPSLTLPYTEESFSLDLLDAKSAGDNVRLTYFVESGGDVIRIDGDRVRVTGLGDARIRILSDETATHRSGETLVDIHIFRTPEIRTGFSYGPGGELRLNVEVEPGSYALEDFHNWSFSYKRAADTSYRTLPVGVPDVFPFYVLPGRLEPEIEYEFRVSATATGRGGGETAYPETHSKLRTPGSGGGLLTGRITGHPGGGTVQVNALSGDVICGAWRGSSAEPFAIDGLADGLYRLEASDGTHTVTSAVEIRDGAPVEQLELYLGGGSSSVEYIQGNAPDVVVFGLDALASMETATDGGQVEYRLAVAGAGGAAIGTEAVRQAADTSETVGPYLDLALHRVRLDHMGRVLEEQFLEALDGVNLTFVYLLPQEIRGMDGYRLLACPSGGPVPLDCVYDPQEGTLRFSTSYLTTLAVLYQHPDRGVGPAAGTETPSREVLLPVNPEETAAVELPVSQLLTMRITLPMVAGSALAALVLALLVGRRMGWLPGKKQAEAVTTEAPVPDHVPRDRELEHLLNQPLPTPPSKLTPAEEVRFFQGIEARRELRRRLSRGEITKEQFRELERQILLKM